MPDEVSGLLVRAMTRLLRLETGTHLYLKFLNGKVDQLMTQANATQEAVNALTQQVAAADNAIQQAVTTIQGLLDEAQANAGGGGGTAPALDLTALQAAVDSLSSHASDDTQWAQDEQGQSHTQPPYIPPEPITDPSVDPPVDPNAPTDPGTDPTPPTDPTTDPNPPTDPGSRTRTPEPTPPTDPNLNPAVDPDNPDTPVVNSALIHSHHPRSRRFRPVHAP